MQFVVAKILEAIYEADFLPMSYGYRPGRGPRDAVKDLTDQLQFGRYNWIVEADIKGFFDNIDHEWILKMLQERIDDKAFLNLIRKWLKAGILDTDGQVAHPATGTPQGGIVSPILANIYLNYVLDPRFDNRVKPRAAGPALIIRYADDFVCAFRHRRDAERFYGHLGDRLSGFGLAVAEDKPRILRFSRWDLKRSQRFEFLGFEFRWAEGRRSGRFVKRRTFPKKLRASVVTFTTWIRRCRHQRPRLSSKQLVADIRDGLDAEALREKYQLSEKALSQFLKELLLRGMIEPSELRERGLDLEAAMADLRTCPACGWEYAGESDDCPKCGVVASRFHAIKERERQPSKFRKFARKPAIGAAVVVVLVIAGALIWVLVVSPRLAGVPPSEPVSSVPPGPPTELHPQLVEAVKIGDIQKVRSLLKRGANVNAMPADWWTPLMWAVERDNPELAQLLLKNGAQVNAMSAERNCCRTALMIACTRDDPRVLEVLLNNGADVNARGGCCDRWTALLDACHNGRERAVKRLLEAGAGVNIPNRDGDTPLMEASGSGCVECARLLLEGGANVNARNKDNWTALMSACYHSKPKVAALLLGRGADARARNDSGSTAQGLADRHCKECALLLKKHAATK